MRKIVLSVTHDDAPDTFELEINVDSKKWSLSQDPYPLLQGVSGGDWALSAPPLSAALSLKQNAKLVMTLSGPPNWAAKGKAGDGGIQADITASCLADNSMSAFVGTIASVDS